MLKEAKFRHGDGIEELLKTEAVMFELAGEVPRLIEHCEALAEALELIAEMGGEARRKDVINHYIFTCGVQTGAADRALELYRSGITEEHF